MNTSTALKLIGLPEQRLNVPADPMPLRYIRKGVYRTRDRRFLVVRNHWGSWYAYSLEYESVRFYGATRKFLMWFLGKLASVQVQCPCCGEFRIKQHWQTREPYIQCRCEHYSQDRYDGRLDEKPCGTMECSHCRLPIPFSHQFFGQDAAGHLWAHHLYAVADPAQEFGSDHALKPEYWHLHFIRHGYGLQLEQVITSGRTSVDGLKGAPAV